MNALRIPFLVARPSRRAGRSLLGRDRRSRHASPRREPRARRRPAARPRGPQCSRSTRGTSGAATLPDRFESKRVFSSCEEFPKSTEPVEIAVVGDVRAPTVKALSPARAACGPPDLRGTDHRHERRRHCSPCQRSSRGQSGRGARHRGRPRPAQQRGPRAFVGSTPRSTSEATRRRSSTADDP